jgi:pyruvate-formate lyase
MDTRLEELRQRTRNGTQQAYRRETPVDVSGECAAEGLSWVLCASRLTRRMCESESVIIEADQKIVFTRTHKSVPPVPVPKEVAPQLEGRVFHELGPISNICADWEMVLSQGLLHRRSVAKATLARVERDSDAADFLMAAIETIDAVLDLAGRYAEEAERLGRRDLAVVLSWVPAHSPNTFHEALQFVRLVQAVLWLSGHYHVGLGRFDQYMWPYLEADLREGRLDQAGAEHLLAEFFISLNRDSDLYPGVQQGDNGQTIMLGGVTRTGASGVNHLTSTVLRVAREVAMIDPKINLRISQDTDLELLEQAAELTRLGLGFPQYSNDEVVIPALISHGYALEDARDYTVAACWEFIIPGKGMEVVNIGAVSFPAAVDEAVRDVLSRGGSFEEILQRTGDGIRRQVDSLLGDFRKLILPPAPFYSVLMDGCLEDGRDLSKGLKYNSFGIHGACSSNAADALAAVKKYVFDEKSIEPQALLDALKDGFEKDDGLRRKLAESEAKVGNDDDEVDGLLVRLFDMFADACETIEDNGRGGRVRPGSGSAMYYIWLATGKEGMREPVVRATADGRRAGDYFAANLAPSPGVKIRGPISVLQSFSKIDYGRICNGGPITVELSDAVFRHEESIQKVAMFIRTFARLGCQQLQLNTLNVDTLKDAKLHPEKHQNLIVRVWGWSGYFCELDAEYQDHVISRHMHLV